MFTVFTIMVIGIIAGYFLRRIPDIKIIGKLITGFIFLLLFFLGIAVGHNEKIVNNLTTIGLQALIITMGAIAGSVGLAWFVYKKFFEKGRE
ncbi:MULTISPECIES: LysO family transporter [unclassified Dysgonomonas]|uniref:LysO family transporter n=1 Tax=unclassified Dysgonomonas TaxID=2630389 RepID=UPI0006819524|nr:MULTISPECIES: LysO family transporter [unclassified Dysgonomonas]MBD8346705.1 LysO family transporter [Dysgonomonas sp. HGC4]MBF0574366.1 LysO family transporter [Dysgonomonas sp. GY617]